MPAQERLRIELDGFDLDELRKHLDASLLQVEQQKPDQAFGEPVTIAVIVLTPLAIRAMAVWIAKQRNRTEIDFDTEVERADGSKETRRLHIKTSSSITEPEVVKQLMDGLKLDPGWTDAVTASEH